jgi:hypothetical protein
MFKGCSQMATTPSNTEITNICEAGIDSYIQEKNKEVISNRITEGMTGAVFATGLYLLFGGYNSFDYRMVLAPFIAGGAYTFVGIRQAKDKDSSYRVAFEQVCSNMRTENDEDAS